MSVMKNEKIKFLETDNTIYEVMVYEVEIIEVKNNKVEIRQGGFHGDIYINDRFYNEWIGKAEKTKKDLLSTLNRVFSKREFPPI